MLQFKLRNFNIDYDNVDIKALLVALLKDRGIRDPEAWLTVSKDDEHDASLLSNIEHAAWLLHDVIEKDKIHPIHIQVDSDADGMTSAAIMYKFLKSVDDNIVITHHIHEGKQHGINLQAALKSPASLIIVPDAGSSDIKQIDTLASEGKLTIVLDHHETNANIEGKDIVNSQLDNYPNPGLSGAGVTLKFCQYYWGKYHKQEDYNWDGLYALAAIGIVADVSGLQNLENQYIIRYGLSKINKHEFFQELLKDRWGNLIENPTIKDIGWTIGPNINAIIRLGSMEEKELLFQTIIEPNKNVISTKRGDDNVVIPQYMEMVRICKNIKSKQTRLVNKSLATIENSGGIDLKDNIIVYVDKDKELSFELSGLIANKLLSAYKRPVVLLKHFEDKMDKKASEQWAGSVRSISVKNCENPKDIFASLSGVVMAEGHQNAHGIRIEKTAFETFLAHAKEVFNKIDFNNQLYTIDAEMSIKNFNKEIGKLFAAEDIWGAGIEKPLALITDIDCLNSEFMGMESQHVKIITPHVNIVAFDASDLIETLKSSKKYLINVIGEFSWDEYEDEPKLQLIVQDYELKQNDNIANWMDF